MEMHRLTTCHHGLILVPIQMQSNRALKRPRRHCCCRCGQRLAPSLASKATATAGHAAGDLILGHAQDLRNTRRCPGRVFIGSHNTDALAVHRRHDDSMCLRAKMPLAPRSERPLNLSSLSRQGLAKLDSRDAGVHRLPLAQGDRLIQAGDREANLLVLLHYRCGRTASLQMSCRDYYTYHHSDAWDMVPHAIEKLLSGVLRAIRSGRAVNAGDASSVNETDDTRHLARLCRVKPDKLGVGSGAQHDCCGGAVEIGVRRIERLSCCVYSPVCASDEL
mmetsp:Transcript_142882/g.319534  ORF Transcript_142882/g.319534 Transcript_142882/m.319534 type:complete len:277 (-) Transcript_142882:728-1558(-)